MKRIWVLLLGLCLTTGVVTTLGCAEDEAEAPSVETEVEEDVSAAEEEVEEAAEEATE